MGDKRNAAWWTVAILAGLAVWGTAGLGSMAWSFAGRDDRDPGDGPAAADDTAPAPLAPGEIVPPGMVLSGPVTCSGSNELHLENRYIRSSGDGVTVEGSCDVTIENSIILASGTGIKIAGSGDVSVERTRIESDVGITIDGSGDATLERVSLEARKAAVLHGSGDVIASDSVLQGDIEAHGSSELVDEGGNVWN